MATLQYPLNIAFPIEDFPSGLAVWKNTIVAIILQSAMTVKNYWLVTWSHYLLVAWLPSAD